MEPENINKRRALAKELYSDLFKALFKIPDKILQKSILELINESVSKNLNRTSNQSDNNNCDTLQIKSEKQLITVVRNKLTKSTQTLNDDTEIFLQKCSQCTKAISNNIVVDNSNINKTEIMPINITNEDNHISILPASKIMSGKQIKLGRTKRVNVPHAKKTNATDISNDTKDINKYSSPSSLKNKNYIKLPIPKEIPQETIGAEIKEELSYDLDKMIYYNICDINEMNIDLSKKDIQQEMLKDWHNCTEPIDDEGYLPIHNAAQLSDAIMLKHQCMVLKHRFNNVDMTTSYGETPLHIAIVFNSSKDIIEMLLDYGANCLLQNEDGNNALHLSVLYSKDVEIFNILLKNIKLNMLDTYNYEGLAVLHLTVIENKFKFARALLQRVDELLNIKTIGKELSDEKLLIVLQDFISSFTGDTKPFIDLNVSKLNFLNQKSMKSGRTAAFLAVNLLSESLSFLLLANGADPRIEDLAGTDCATLSTDIVNNKLILSAVYNSSYYLRQYEFEIMNQDRRIVITNNLTQEINNDLKKLPIVGEKTILGKNKIKLPEENKNLPPSPFKNLKRLLPQKSVSKRRKKNN